MKADFLSLLAALPQPPQPGYPDGAPFVEALAHGAMRVELFAPGSSGLTKDIQQPHEQDELYVVQRGRSDFFLNGACLHVAPGDVLFVPAGAEHRFENFTQDFTTWVIFYGPKDGEGESP